MPPMRCKRTQLQLSGFEFLDMCAHVCCRSAKRQEDMIDGTPDESARDLVTKASQGFIDLTTADYKERCQKRPATQDVVSVGMSARCCPPANIIMPAVPKRLSIGCATRGIPRKAIERYPHGNCATCFCNHCERT